MAVNSILSGSPHARPMGRTCGEPNEIKINTHPKTFTALFRERTELVEGEPGGNRVLQHTAPHPVHDLDEGVRLEEVRRGLHVDRPVRGHAAVHDVAQDWPGREEPGER